MKHHLKTLSTLVLLLLPYFAISQGATTSSISGTIEDAEGNGIPGAVVSATHEPTGTRYNTVSHSNGRFSISNAKVGGPYDISITSVGYQTYEVTSSPLHSYIFRSKKGPES